MFCAWQPIVPYQKTLMGFLLAARWLVDDSGTILAEGRLILHHPHFPEILSPRRFRATVYQPGADKSNRWVVVKGWVIREY